MCLLYVSLGSRVSPSIIGLMVMGSVMLSIGSSSCVLYSAGSGVRELCCLVWVENEVDCRSPCRYDWMFAIFMSLCVDVTVMSLCVDVTVMSSA